MQGNYIIIINGYYRVVLIVQLCILSSYTIIRVSLHVAIILYNIFNTIIGMMPDHRTPPPPLPTHTEYRLNVLLISCFHLFLIY